jgi:monothiol glutaredoxin
MMQRPHLPETQVHSAVREKMAKYHESVIAQVTQAISDNDVVVLGMKQNPFPGRAKRLLESKAIPFKYLEWGSYLSQWKPRLAIKLWSGWPTFPQIFVRGTLIGGYTDLERLIESGEFKQLLDAPRAN